MRDTRTILLAMLSVGLVGSWVYQLYDDSQESSSNGPAAVKAEVPA